MLKNCQVPPRFELGSLDSESKVLTITPWDRSCQVGSKIKRISENLNRDEMIRGCEKTNQIDPGILISPDHIQNTAQGQEASILINIMSQLVSPPQWTKNILKVGINQIIWKRASELSVKKNKAAPSIPFPLHFIIVKHEFLLKSA